MLRLRGLFSIRTWLTLAFAVIAAVTASTTVWVLSRAVAERGFRRYAEEFAVGNAVAVAESIKHARTGPELQQQLQKLATRRHMALFAFDARGRLLTAPISNGARWLDFPLAARALSVARTGNRFIEGRRSGSVVVVGLRVRQGAASELVAYARRPELRTQLGIVRNEFSRAALFAILAGAATGLLIATLIAVRLRRIAAAAEAIGAGELTHAQAIDRFPDEVGGLAASIDRMRAATSGCLLAHRVGTRPARAPT